MSTPLLDKNRIEAFSDGVIAIIITLLVLEIKVPHISGEVTTAAVVAALGAVAPKFFSWALSFFMVLIMWVNHHRIFEDINHTDNGLLWANGLLLFFMSFVPFPTAFLGDYYMEPVSVCFFGLCLALLGASFVILRVYLLNHQTLLKEGVDLQHYRSLARKSLLSPVLYGSGAVIAFVSVYASYAIYLFIPLYFVFFTTRGNQE